jgi:hypothetical protein
MCVPSILEPKISLRTRNLSLNLNQSQIAKTLADYILTAEAYSTNYLPKYTQLTSRNFENQFTWGRLRSMVAVYWRRCSGRCRASGMELCLLWNSDRLRGGRNADELLCCRVLTTSRGQVTIAPTVPATLYTEEKTIEMNIWMSFDNSPQLS